MKLQYLFIAVPIAVFSLIANSPALADYLTPTGRGLNGGRSYNFGDYEDANTLDQSPFHDNTIQDRDGNLYDLNPFGTYERRR
tara:strand:+ start:558 stop:806 length:249 start_codon:yes stop_codon:yes gene_type:complete